MSAYFVTAIGTDSGKTLASAILCQSLGAAYWKPIQSGLPGDSDTLRQWLPGVQIVPERYVFQTPASPHFAAKVEHQTIGLKDFTLPHYSELIVEGAGGLLVPINETETMADLIAHLDIPIILVVNHYLGALNHTLLTIAEIQKRGLKLEGIIFNRTDFQDAEPIILQKAGCRCLLRIPEIEAVNEIQIRQLSQNLIWS